MRNAIAVVFVMGILAAGVDTPAAAEKEGLPLNIMSFNIRLSPAADGPDSWEYRKFMVLDMLHHYDADIVATQETMIDQAEFIDRHMDAYHWFGVGRNKDGGSEHMAIFYKPDVVRPIESGNLWLSETPDVPGSRSWDSSLPRMVTWARFQYLPTDTQFYVYNTHFDHRGSRAREESARLIAEWVNERAADTPVIVLGDFNARGEDSEPWRILTEDADLLDAWLTADETKGPVTTWSAFGPPDPDSDRRIDWILYRGPIHAHLCETVLYNQEGRYPSDHYPVFARLTLHP